MANNWVKQKSLNFRYKLLKKPKQIEKFRISDYNLSKEKQEQNCLQNFVAFKISAHFFFFFSVTIWYRCSLISKLSTSKSNKKKEKRRKLWFSVKFEVVSANNPMVLHLGLNAKKSNCFAVFDIDLQDTGLQNEKKTEEKYKNLQKKGKLLLPLLLSWSNSLKSSIIIFTSDSDKKRLSVWLTR